MEASEIEIALLRGFDLLKNEYPELKMSIDNDALGAIAQLAFGDVRKSLNILEVCFMTAIGNNETLISTATVSNVSDRPAMRYDRDGDSHYDILSAFQKSVRGRTALSGKTYRGGRPDFNMPQTYGYRIGGYRTCVSECGGDCEILR